MRRTATKLTSMILLSMGRELIGRDECRKYYWTGIRMVGLARKAQVEAQSVHIYFVSNTDIYIPKTIKLNKSPRNPKLGTRSAFIWCALAGHVMFLRAERWNIIESFTIHHPCAMGKLFLILKIDFFEAQTMLDLLRNVLHSPYPLV